MMKIRSPEEVLRDIISLKGLNYVGPRGNKNGGAVIVGEAPGADEDRTGLPFIGPSGKELGRMCSDAGWPGSYQVLGGEKIYVPEDLWFTNVFKVRPPENKLPRLAEYGIPTSVFIDTFLSELRSSRPAIIIATGNTSLGYLCPETRGKDSSARIGTYRGSLLQSKVLDWEHYVIPMYHPAFILREWKERPVGVFCLERAWEEFSYFQRMGSLQPLPCRKLKIQPDYATLYGFLYKCLNPVPLRVSIDIELLGGAWPYTWAIATSPWEAISFSLWDYEPGQLVVIWRLLNEILRLCPQIGQNYIGFDSSWNEWLGMEPNLSIFTSPTDDTMVLHHVLWPEFPHKLQFIGMQYTREPYWKDEGRKWKPKDGKTKLMHYNALDAACTYEIMLGMEKELEARCKEEKATDC